MSAHSYFSIVSALARALLRPYVASHPCRAHLNLVIDLMTIIRHVKCDNCNIAVAPYIDRQLPEGWEYRPCLEMHCCKACLKCWYDLCFDPSDTNCSSCMSRAHHLASSPHNSCGELATTIWGARYWRTRQQYRRAGYWRTRPNHW